MTAGAPGSPSARRSLLWKLEGSAWDSAGLAGLDLCHAELHADRLWARGAMLVAGAEPFRVDYEVETGAGFVTEHLAVSVATGLEGRSVDLRRGRSPELDTALDVDLAGSALFNTLPILRLGLLGSRAGEAHDIEAAFVRIPDLDVVPSAQRYTVLGEGRVRYASLDSGFTADLEVDPEGFVLVYPAVAARLRPAS